jgi:hypothetical protein
VQSGGRLSRRALLGAALLTVAGCRHTSSSARPPAPAPDASALATARTIERQLIASYDARIATAAPGEVAVLQAARSLHTVHLQALAGAEGDPTGVVVVTDLRRTLLQSATTLRRLALTATDGTDAALLASIAASHLTSAR